MKKLMMVAAAMVAAWCSWGAENISVEEVANHYPWDGKVDCVSTLSGLADYGYYEGVFTLSVKQGGETVRKVVTNVFANAFGSANGTYTNTFDCAALFGEGHYPNGGIKVSLVKKDLDGVQLWENGPYWAECNVGATKPEEPGYYFWWGDTGGYKRNAEGNGWVSVKDGTTTHLFTTNSCPTAKKTPDQLKAEGYIDNTTGNLVAEYDAAIVYLGAPWRLPTDAEMQGLVDNCKSSWTNNWNGTGVNGRIVRGKGAYESKSIFLPAVGRGVDSELKSYGEYGYSWSSTPTSDVLYSLMGAQMIYYYDNNMMSDHVVRDFTPRLFGQTIRPVRGFVK